MMTMSPAARDPTLANEPPGINLGRSSLNSPTASIASSLLKRWPWPEKRRRWSLVRRIHGGGLFERDARIDEGVCASTRAGCSLSRGVHNSLERARLCLGRSSRQCSWPRPISGRFGCKSPRPPEDLGWPTSHLTKTMSSMDAIPEVMQEQVKAVSRSPAMRSPSTLTCACQREILRC
jgi:hypothetical protein